MGRLKDPWKEKLSGKKKGGPGRGDGIGGKVNNASCPFTMANIERKIEKGKSKVTHTRGGSRHFSHLFRGPVNEVWL